MGDPLPHLEGERSKVKVTSQNSFSFAARPTADGSN